MIKFQLALLWVVGRISENSGIEAPGDPITALDHYSMLVCM